MSAKEWTKEKARLTSGPERASPAAVSRGGLVTFVGPGSHQPGCHFSFHFLLPVPFHSCQIHLLCSSLSIVSQIQHLTFVLIFWMLDCSLVHPSEWHSHLFILGSSCHRNEKKSIYPAWCKALEKSPLVYCLHWHKIMSSNLIFLVYLFIPFVRNVASEEPQHGKTVTILPRITFLLSYCMYCKLRIRLIPNTSSSVVMSLVFQTYYQHYECTECFRMQDKNSMSAVFIRVCKWDL